MPRDTADRPSAAASRRDATELAPVLEPAGLALLDSLGRDDEDRAVADPWPCPGGCAQPDTSRGSSPPC